jgi:hypothetical protein
MCFHANSKACILAAPTSCDTASGRVPTALKMWRPLCQPFPMLSLAICLVDVGLPRFAHLTSLSSLSRQDSYFGGSAASVALPGSPLTIVFSLPPQTQHLISQMNSAVTLLPKYTTGEDSNSVAESHDRQTPSVRTHCFFTRSLSVMDRENSVSPISVHRDQHAVLPPWEARTVAQVPFMEPVSPTPLRGHDQGLYAARLTSQANHRPKLSASTSAPCGTDYSSPVSLHSSSMPWKSAAVTPSGQPTIVPPYETSVCHRPSYDRPAYEGQNRSKPPFRKAASQPTPRYGPQVPPTPPDSVSRSSLRSASSSPPTRPVSKALPGTMSSRTSRNRSASRNRKRAGGREHGYDHQQIDNDQTGIGKRLKSVFRDMFKKDPVDDTQFERIADRHWTDEY